MTDDHIFYQGFMTAIRTKIPHKATLANTITDLLGIDKDAVYRRLRGEVYFTFAEMAIIAKSLGISLDNIVGIISAEQSRPIQMVITRQVNPTPDDYKMIKDHLDILEIIKDEPGTKLMEASNIFSHYIYNDYECITRFYLFKWNQASQLGSALPYHEIIIPDQMREMQRQACECARHISSTSYIWDYMIFQNFVADVKYYASIQLITKEDVALIKNDLSDFLDKIEQIAVTGKHEKTGNEVSLFISDINFDTSYSCLQSKNIRLSMVRTFVLNATVALDNEVFNEMSHWIRSMQRMSTLISVSGEKVRSLFFDAQRKLIDTL